MNFQMLISMAQQMKKMPNIKLTSEQQKIANDLKSKSKEEQAQMLADKCNSLGINKEQLEQLITMFK